jgi:hypothetical protein
MHQKEAWVAGAACRGFAPAPPGFCALVPLPMWALCRQPAERGMPQHPPASVEATESALGLLPSMALSSAQSGLILLREDKRRIFSRGAERITLNLRGKWSC